MMLQLKDFDYLPQMDELIGQVVANPSGLVLVAGLDPRPRDLAGPRLLSSARSTFFGVLVRQMLAAHQLSRAVVIAEEKNTVHLSRGRRSGIEYRPVKPPFTYEEMIAQAAAEEHDLLVIDRLDEEAAAAAVEAARRGRWVVSQLDCVFSGADVAHHLLDLGVPRDQLDPLNWIITVQRLPTLCEHCKEPIEPNAAWLAALRNRYPGIATKGTYYRARGCVRCRGEGRKGDAAYFDVFRAPQDRSALFDHPSVLAAEAYALELARQGRIAVEDVQDLDAERLRRTFLLLTSSEHALSRANADLTQRVGELQAANRVLEQRTASLVSLQEIAQTLITSTDLRNLADRICRLGHRLGGADRAILYIFRGDDCQVLAVHGWDPALVLARLDRKQVLDKTCESSSHEVSAPEPFRGFPPGIASVHPDVLGAELRAGLRVPLIAQQETVGLMIVHSTLKPRFTQGEIALWQAFANQAAIAIQRARLIEDLQSSITQLQAAQAELIKKERLERELELARQVQQSLLPRHFPEMPGYALAGRSEAARRVGGDFYAVLPLDDDHFGVAIADVSDKGMAAALFMALTRSLLLAEAHRELSPREVLSQVHRLLLELGEQDMFVTMFYGVIEMGTRRLTYARAGHEKPLVLRDGGVLQLEGRGRFLGLLEDQELGLSEETVALQPGDRLVLFTDGLVDALSQEQEPFGEERLQQLLVAHASLAPADLCAETFAIINAHQGPTEPYDDMTMLAVGVMGKAQ